MANKQITSFIIDLAPSMGAMTHHGQFKEYTDLEIALEYVNNQITRRILKGRKTDYIQSYVSCTDPSENKSFEEIDPDEDDLLKKAGVKSEKLMATAKILPLKSPPSSYDLNILSHLKASDKNHNKENGDFLGRLWINILKSLNDIVTFTKKKKFPGKDIILLTNFREFSDIAMFDEGKASINQLLSAIKKMLEQENIVLKIFDVGYDDVEHQESVKYEGARKKMIKGWKQLISQIPNNVKFYTSSSIFEELSSPAAKPVVPIKVFRGELRFGFDPTQVLKEAHVGTINNENDDGNADATEELLSSFDKLKFEVDAYPALKSEPAGTGSIFLKSMVERSPNDVDKYYDLNQYEVKRITEKFIMQKRSPKDIEKIRAEKKRRGEIEKQKKLENNNNVNNDASVHENGEDEDDEEDIDVDFYQQILIDDNDTEKSYRYASSYVPFSKQLEEVRIYKTVPGIDFRGITKLSKLPPWYLLSEPVFVVPTMGSSLKNQMGLAALVRSLIDLESALVARYVSKTDSPVQMVALLPVIINDGVSSKKRGPETMVGRDNYKFVTGIKYEFVMVKLPFAEDEKISYFTSLDSLNTRSGEVLTEHETLLPTGEMKSLMKDYILGMDMDDEPRSPNVFKDDSKLFLPRLDQNMGGSAQKNSSSFDEKLSYPNQGVHFVELLIKHVAFTAAKQGITTTEYTNQLKGKMFQKEHLTPVEQKVLNSLTRLSYRDTEKLGKANVSLKKLVNLLDVKYVETETVASRKNKARKEREEEEKEEGIELLGEFGEGEEVDLDALLGLA